MELVTLWTKIRNLFIEGGAKVGLGKTLGNVTDDSRVALPASEVARIKELKQYYLDDFDKVVYKNSYGELRQRQFHSINITKLASRRLASLIFNEQCSVKVSDNNTQMFLDSVLRDNDFYLTFETYLEKFIALGSGCIRPYVSHNKIKLAWATADQVFPLEANTNEVTQVAIASKTMKVENHANIYYTLLEFHQFDEAKGTYTVTNELYRSSQKDEVGIQVPLDSIQEYEGLAESVTIPTDKPLFAFYKNAGANNKCLESPMGLGLIDNSKTTVDAINRTHDQFIEEVRKGQRRIIVPEEWLKMRTTRARHGQQDTAHPLMFDADETVYQGMYGDPSEIGFHDVTTDIRVEQYTQTMDFFLHEFENQTGLSQGTFTQSPSGVQTATEIVTNNSTTYQTRSSYLTMVEKTIKALVNAILELAQCYQLFDDGKPKWTGDINSIETTVDFNDGVFIDQDAQFKNDISAVSAGVLPEKEFMKRNYNLSDSEAEQWVEELKSEKVQPAASYEQFDPLKDGEVDGSTSKNDEESKEDN